MKSLVGNKAKTQRRRNGPGSKRRPSDAKPAQCCAKVSKIVAGCHD
jgi:hypothetical protein